MIASVLEGEHYDVVIAPTGEDGFFRAIAEPFDVVVLLLPLTPSVATTYDQKTTQVRVEG